MYLQYIHSINDNMSSLDMYNEPILSYYTKTDLWNNSIVNTELMLIINKCMFSLIDKNVIKIYGHYLCLSGPINRLSLSNVVIYENIAISFTFRQCQ